MVTATSRRLKNKKQMEETQRPNLSFLTGKSFQTMEEFEKFHEECDEEKKQIIENAVTLVPELIQIAEMFYDRSSDDSLNRSIVKSVLNEIINKNQFVKNG